MNVYPLLLVAVVSLFTPLGLSVRMRTLCKLS